MKKAPRIHVIGSVNVDFVIQTQTLPRAGETIGGGAFSTVPGGKGANQALAARQLGADVRFTACVGDDEFAEIALSNLRAAGVNLDDVHHISGVATGAAFINLASDGENQIAVASGANGLLSAEHLHDAAADAVIAQLETPEAASLAAASKCDVFFCLNTAPAIPVSDALFAAADLLVMNETESAFYAEQLGDYRGLIARTYGANGAAIFRCGEKLAEAMPPHVDVVDTTGAGDTFTGALTTALASGLSHQDALDFACVAGALATTKLGAQSGMPTGTEVRRVLSQ